MAHKKQSSTRKEAGGLISPIPGVVAALRHTQAFQTEIDLISVQQAQAKANLDLDIQVQRARGNALKQWIDLDVAAENLRKVFYK